jgi:RNA polymerase sigma factor (sigma-70 family)
MTAPSNSTAVLWALGASQAQPICPTWINRIQQGDESAARTLMRRLYPTVIRWVRWCSCSSAEEEKMTQRVMLSLLRKPGSSTRYDSLEQWAAQLTVRTCLRHNHVRLSAPFALSDRSIQTNLHPGQPTDHTSRRTPELDQSAEGDLFQKALTGLKADQRLVLMLIHSHSWSCREIGHWTGWAIWRIRWKAFCGRRKLRAHWKMIQKTFSSLN